MESSENNSFYIYSESKPPEYLSGILDKIWVFDSAVNSADDPHFGLIPDFTTSLIAVIPVDKPSLRLFITGPNSSNMKFETYPSQVTLGFRFMPGIISSFLNIHPKETLNKRIPLEELFTGSQLTDLSAAVKSVKSIKEKTLKISRFILRHINKEKFADDEISDSINRIIESDGSLKLEAIYSGLSISPRQFQRNFTKRTGISPKEFSRIVRFHKAARKLVNNNFRHFDTLVESGYYDQSHYYREFREFLGMLPGKFENRQKKIEYKELLK